MAPGSLTSDDPGYLQGQEDFSRDAPARRAAHVSVVERRGAGGAPRPIFLCPDCGEWCLTENKYQNHWYDTHVPEALSGATRKPLVTVDERGVATYHIDAITPGTGRYFYGCGPETCPSCGQQRAPLKQEGWWRCDTKKCPAQGRVKDHRPDWPRFEVNGRG